MSASSMLNLMAGNNPAIAAQILSADDHNYYEQSSADPFFMEPGDLRQHPDDMEEEEEDEDDTGDYMPPGCQGYRVRLEGTKHKLHTGTMPSYRSCTSVHRHV